VHITDFEGEFIWSEYAAAWCETCEWQSPVTKKVSQELKGEVVFLTIMTARSEKYEDNADEHTAKDWAEKFALDKTRTLAAVELWSKTIPEHRFYSPEGHLLFAHVGALSGDQIKEVITYYRSDWDQWKKTGEKASWMK